MGGKGRWYGSLLLVITCTGIVWAEPIVVRGELFPGLLGKPVNAFRLRDREGTLLPVQIDEVTEEGEYVCDRGEAANPDEGNGTLDGRDEIVFMNEDCLPCREPSVAETTPDDSGSGPNAVIVRTGTVDNCREAILFIDSTVPPCQKSYITYDHANQQVTTPRYFAHFAPDRFHFTKAGIAGKRPGSWIHLTNELGIEIRLRALWGLVPVRYTEENLICFVKRYKAGPLRLIRRGDLHLKIGPGIRGGRAAVNQICYPSMVSVPVSVNLPVRFRHFFRDAYLEMTPVIAEGGDGFVFSVSGGEGIEYPVTAGDTVDTLYPCPLTAHPFTILRKNSGLGWVVQTDIPDVQGMRGGFLFRRPSRRGGRADCGYRLVIQDVPRGRYIVSNRVVFTRMDHPSIAEEFNALDTPVPVLCGNVMAVNQLTDDIHPVSGGVEKRKKP